MILSTRYGLIFLIFITFWGCEPKKEVYVSENGIKLSSFIKDGCTGGATSSDESLSNIFNRVSALGLKRDQISVSTAHQGEDDTIYSVYINNIDSRKNYAALKVIILNQNWDEDTIKVMKIISESP